MRFNKEGKEKRADAYSSSPSHLWSMRLFESMSADGSLALLESMSHGSS
jgi:hypothetical protein